MRRLIKSFSEGYFLEYDQGAFDQWCIFLKEPGQERVALTDLKVFSEVHVLGATHGKLKLYFDFIDVFERTSTAMDERVLNDITKRSKHYEGDEVSADRIITSLYAGMVAEENKDRAILKKRIKRLGVHQVLVEDRTPQAAANYSRGRKAEELKLECKARGF